MPGGTSAASLPARLGLGRKTPPRMGKGRTCGSRGGATAPGRGAGVRTDRPASSAYSIRPLRRGHKVGRPGHIRSAPAAVVDSDYFAKGASAFHDFADPI